MNHIQQKRLAVRKALQIAGTQDALAALVGKKQQNVRYWLVHGLPLKHVIEMEQKLNCQVTRFEFAPDIFGNKT